jgi:uncharacterized protein YrrD
MLSHVHLGAKAEGRLGEELGKIKYLVIAPDTDQLTHVVIEKGLFDHREVVVEASRVKGFSEDNRRVHLDLSAAELEDLPDFVEREYVNIGVYGSAEGRLAPNLPPLDAYSYLYPVETIPIGEPYTEVTNVPEGSLLVRVGATVEALDGELGTVKDVNFDPLSGQVISFEVEKGVFFTEDFLVPVDMVKSADESCVYLKVNKHEVNKISHHGSDDSYTLSAK